MAFDMFEHLICSNRHWPWAKSVCISMHADDASLTSKFHENNPTIDNVLFQKSEIRQARLRNLEGYGLMWKLLLYPHVYFVV
jgi:hypothetical protein